MALSPSRLNWTQNSLLSVRSIDSPPSLSGIFSTVVIISPATSDLWILGVIPSDSQNINLRKGILVLGMRKWPTLKTWNQVRGHAQTCLTKYTCDFWVLVITPNVSIHINTRLDWMYTTLSAQNIRNTCAFHDTDWTGQSRWKLWSLIDVTC